MSIIGKLKKLVRVAFNIFYQRFYIRILFKNQLTDQDYTSKVSNDFHELFYNAHNFNGTWINTIWLGINVLKNPLDLWILQELIFKINPDIIIETGTKYGGNAFYMASMCDLIDNGKIITIDIEDQENKPQHKRIKYLLGSSLSPEISEQVQGLIGGSDKVLVVLDSLHIKDHVLEELRIYGKFVSKGSYIIVEDTNLNGHPIAPFFGPGPMEAVFEFLKENKDFKIDKNREKYYMTFNPNGYLIKIR